MQEKAFQRPDVSTYLIFVVLTVYRERRRDGDGARLVLRLADVDALVPGTRSLDGEHSAAVDRGGRGGGQGAVLAVPNLDVKMLNFSLCTG